MHAKRTWVAVAAGLMALAIPASATGATPIGTTFPGSDLSCGSDATVLQSTSPSGGSYAAPFAGVITSWSFQPGTFVPTSLKLKVGRSAGGDSFAIVGESPSKIPALGPNSYTDVRISVQPGDVIGFYAGPGSPGECGKSDSSFEAHAFQPGDHLPGSPPLEYNDIPGFQLSISAILEPDADGDGFGDETQDLCPTDATKQDECVPPTATITKGPKDKTKKKRTTFEFTGTDARAVASFQCKLDSGAFESCTSPHTVKVRKGKHHFEVQAVDGAGNVGSPASDDWKVKKKKKKK
jgi:hypothetical protein